MKAGGKKFGCFRAQYTHTNSHTHLGTLPHLPLQPRLLDSLSVLGCLVIRKVLCVRAPKRKEKYRKKRVSRASVRLTDRIAAALSNVVAAHIT